MKAVLLFPPLWAPMLPHLALPSLTAYLRQHGVEVIQRDLSIEVLDQVLSRNHLRAVLRQLQRSQRLTNGPRGGRLEQLRARAAAWALQEGPKVARRVDEAKAVLRSARFHDLEASLEAFAVVNDGLDLASAPYVPSRMYLTSFESGYPTDAGQAILAAVRDRQHNPFRDLFQRTIVPEIAREQPDVVGISVTSAHQVVAAFTLAALIKEARLPTHVTVGGKMITCWRDLLPRQDALWQLFDSAVLYQGEVPLLRLVEALERGADLATVPGLMYRDVAGVQVNPPAEPLPSAALPAPDFDGLPLARYLVPEPVLPIVASSGCYWGRCAFCNVGYGESRRFSERRAQQVAAQMIDLAGRYKVRHFFFADEALSPRMLKGLSTALIAPGAHLNWTCCARFEPGISAPLLQQMRQAGCRMLLFGLESASQRVLDRMDKGTQLATAQRVLSDSLQAGIWNHVFVFFGFPGEMETEAQQTVDFFAANRPLIHSISAGTFLLERHARVAEDPAAYGVSRLFSPPDRDLAYYYDYEAEAGISPERAEEIRQAFLETLPDKTTPQYYFHDVYRFLYASHFGPAEAFPTLLGSEEG